MTTPTNVTVRLATITDLPAIQSLYAETGLDDGIPLPLAAAEDMFRRFESYPFYKLWVADAGAAIVGTYALLVMDNIAHEAKPLAVIEQVAVGTRVQGAGVGTRMMHHAREVAAAKGCYKLMLSSNVKRTKAHDFYDKLGFTRHGYSFLVEFDRADADEPR